MTRGSRILTIALAAGFGLMMATATGAQASGALMVEGEVLPQGMPVEIEAIGESYLSLVENGIKLRCAYAEMKGIAANDEEGTARGEGTVIGHECEVVGNSFCTIYPTQEDMENETHAGLVVASSGEIFVRSFGKQRYLQGSASATIFHGGPACTLPEEVEISGTAAGKVNEPFTELVTHVVQDITEAEEELLEVAAFYGNERLRVDEGTAAGHLVGKFKGRTFSVN